VDEGWRQAIEAACDPLSLAVFRLRFGDGLSAPEVARRCRLDPSSLQAVVEGLRELVRSEARARTLSNLPVGIAWVDRLLARVAESAGIGCPSADQLSRRAGSGGADGAQDRRVRDHIESCPRCARAVRMLRAGILHPRQLQAPPGGPRPEGRVSLLALHLHPRGRGHQKALVAAFGRGARRVGDDALLVDLGRVPAWKEILEQRVRMGLPLRDHVRGARVDGEGSWTSRLVIGPVPVAALEASRARPWGEVDGVAALPDPLPPPPSVARWWSGTVAVGLLAVLVGFWVMLEREDHAAFPLRVQAQDGGGALVARFDVDDRAFVNAYTLGSTGVVAQLESASSADKAAVATGDGGYELVTLDRGLVIVSSSEPIEGLDLVCEARDLVGDDHGRIRERIIALHPDSDVAVFLTED